MMLVTVPDPVAFCADAPAAEKSPAIKATESKFFFTRLSLM
jgi:hypothetical protein